MRVGVGFDAHCFGERRPLILGGVEIDKERGLVGHSDADVLIHAVCDAMLGAAALGDIGELFPDSDPRWRGATGARLLSITLSQLSSKGFMVNNVDVTVIAEWPRLAPFRTRIRTRLAEIIEIEEDRISVKATTTEGMGFVGRGEGVAAWAAVTLRLVRRKGEQEEVCDE